APFIQPWARVTTRLFQAVENIGLATSGMLGARLGDRLGMQISWMTLIRRIMARPCAPVEQVVQLGIDDFSFRRGRKFGTILVDMQSRKIIDLLPDRKAETASVWMSAHGGFCILPRNGVLVSGEYAKTPSFHMRDSSTCFLAWSDNERFFQTPEDSFRFKLDGISLSTVFAIGILPPQYSLSHSFSFGT